MPRVYLTPTELSALPLGLALANQLNSLPTGAIDSLLARASMRCDSFCERRLQAPGTTTLSGGVSAGGLSLNVTSTTTLDNLSELAAIVDVGNSNAETVQIQSGGVNVTNPSAPYPGTLTLDPTTPLRSGHLNGAPVQYCYREVRESITASMNDPYSEALMSQAAQLALAHLPTVHAGLTRISFLKSYPIMSVSLIEHSYSYDTTYNVVYNATDPTFQGQIIIEPAAGYIRYRVGTVILPYGNIRATYIGGFSTIPDDIKSAVSFYLADDLVRFVNPYGATDIQMGKRRQAWAMALTKTPNVQQAEVLLCKYRRMT